MKDPTTRVAPPGFHIVRPEIREEAPSHVAMPRIVHWGSGQRAEIALTFDDGPSRWTVDIASSFERHGCRATFFLSGAAVATQPHVVATLAAAEHELGNHLWSHRDASTQETIELRNEIERTADAIEAAGASRPVLVRPPFFRAPQAVAEAAAGTDIKMVVMRSIGSSDWQAETAEEVVNPVLSNAQPGDIVCLHDGVSPDRRDNSRHGRQPTVDAVARLVPALIGRGLWPVTVSRLLR